MFSTRLIDVSTGLFLGLELLMNILLQFLIHFFQAAAVGVTHVDEVFPCVEELTALDILYVVLLCQSSKKDFRYRRA